MSNMLCLQWRTCFKKRILVILSTVALGKTLKVYSNIIVTKLVTFLCVRIKNWCNETQQWKIIKQQRWRKSIELGWGFYTYKKWDWSKIRLFKSNTESRKLWKAFIDHMRNYFNVFLILTGWRHLEMCKQMYIYCTL